MEGDMSQFLGGVGTLLLLVGLAVAIFWKGKRRKGLIVIGIGFAVGLTGGLLGSGDVEAGKAAGFSSVTEYRTAKAAGFNDAATYQAHQKEEAEKARLAKAAKDEEDRKQKEAAEAACKTDLQCWGNKYSVEAAVTCQPIIERMAKWSYKWTDGMLEPKFSHFRWKDKGRGTVTYIGDKLQLQNGFGAWGNVIYECDYSPATDKVVDVRVHQGRI
jgi:hypothetical protein